MLLPAQEFALDRISKIPLLHPLRPPVHGYDFSARSCNAAATSSQIYRKNMLSAPPPHFVVSTGLESFQAKCVVANSKLLRVHKAKMITPQVERDYCQKIATIGTLLCR